ncbi:MAG: hypothetical protein AAF152_17695 [Cyanobacteria bacterium P01_A01_bin.114]
MQIFPAPPIKSFERLQVTEGLLITRDRWQGTQAYHRQRQNFQFQALYQPGIICGLGVTVVAAPEEIEAQYRDGRWLQIQPGIAIDAAGNPIVVPRPEVFQLRSTPQPKSPQPKIPQQKTPQQKTPQPDTVVYLVLNYVDPDDLKYPPDQETVPETFRIIEKTALDTLDVELCRIVLTDSAQDLGLATNVYQPTPQTLDHRYRLPVRSRPHGTVRVAQITAVPARDRAVHKGLSHLLKAADSLYPRLQGEGPIQPIFHQSLAGTKLAPYDLIMCPHEQVPDLTKAALPTLKHYLLSGGILCFCADISGTQLENLHTIRQELMLALSDLKSLPDDTTVEASLLSEIEATETEITRQIQGFCRSIFQFAAQMKYPIDGFGQLERTHPLLTEPFLFAQLPKINHQPVHIFCWGGIVLMIGNLVNAWQLDERLTLSRETIRTTQELGINLLHFARRHHHLAQLQAPTAQHPSLKNIASSGG